MNVRLCVVPSAVTVAGKLRSETPAPANGTSIVSPAVERAERSLRIGVGQAARVERGPGGRCGLEVNGEGRGNGPRTGLRARPLRAARRRTGTVPIAATAAIRTPTCGRLRCPTADPSVRVSTHARAADHGMGECRRTGATALGPGGTLAEPPRSVQEVFEIVRPGSRRFGQTCRDRPRASAIADARSRSHTRARRSGSAAGPGDTR